MKNIFSTKKRAELASKKLNESELRYRRLFESAKDGILILDFKTGKIVDANPFIINLIDYPLNEVLGKELWEIGLFSHKKQSKQAFSELKKNNYIRFDDMPILRKNGKITEVEFVSNVYLVNQTKVVQCNIRDITERQRTERALHEVEEKYKSILDNSADAIFITNPLGNYIYTNKAVTDLLGYSADEMKHKSIKDITVIKEGLKFSEILGGVKNNDKIFTEVELLKNDGTYILTDLNSVILPDGQIYASCRDITDRKQDEVALFESEKNLKKQNKEYFDLNKKYLTLNIELVKSLSQIKKLNSELIVSTTKAEESDNLKSAFLANISHEIRTPLNAIMGFSQLLLNPGLSNGKLDQYVQIIHSSSDQLLSIISDIIDISKIATGQIAIASEAINVHTLLRDLFSVYNKLTEFKKLNLYCNFDNTNDSIQIITDGNRIRQVLCNLLNNAIKFTKEGNIEFGYVIKENFIEFYVKDNGIGIASENQELIFQRFRQLETTNTRDYGGNGLGLSISKALVNKMGGTIAVKSELGVGSTFSFTIPYIKTDEGGHMAKQKSKSEPIYEWAEKSILIVEDEINSHTYFEELFFDSRVQLFHAWDGRQAVEMMKNNPQISLVLMDIKMPIMDGYTATRIIKRMLPKTPIIAQTAYVLGIDKEIALNAGCDDYISKPIDRNLLMELINRHLS